MKSRRQKVSEDGLTISRSSSRSTTSTNESENSLPIPIDLIFEILSRLPAKCIARCRCVSKFWASLIRLPGFTELFLTKSSARPKLLLACEKNNELYFFSSSLPQNPDEKSSSVAASYHMKIPLKFSFQLFSPINGLVCLRDERILPGRKKPALVSVVCNPSTGESFTLPKMKTRRTFDVKSYFGYDPIEKQFKVLSMTLPYGIYNGNYEEYQVLTLGTGKLSWRLIECCIPHCPVYNGVCVNGVLYYLASVNGSSEVTVVVCFDIRSEKFRFMKVMENFSGSATLINYNGKLGSLVSEMFFVYSGRATSFEFWVLEDPERHEWSKHSYTLPPLSWNVARDTELYFVGVIGTNEIVLSPRCLYDLLYLFYFNIKRNTIVRVEIQGMEPLERGRLHTFLNHLENVKLMQSDLRL